MVNTQFEIRNIGLQEIDELAIFINKCGDSLKTFRYFENRGFDIISNHLITALLLYKGEAVAYGHLDNEDGKIWLGIIVSNKEIGNGYGGKMMSHLITYINSNKISKVYLTVDKTNSIAIKLYNKYDFSEISEISEKSYLMLRQK